MLNLTLQTIGAGEQGSQPICLYAWALQCAAKVKALTNLTGFVWIASETRF